MRAKETIGCVAFLLLCAILAVMVASSSGKNPFQPISFDFGSMAQAGINWLVENMRGFFQSVKVPIKLVFDAILAAMNGIHPAILIIAMFLIGWQLSGVSLALLVTAGLMVIGVIGAWDQAMLTLSLTISSVFFCLIVGIPLGILMAKKEGVARVVRPILDIMQTCPAFVYLIPIVMLIGIGNVPGIAVTFIFALPPIVRLTYLGIRQVPESVVEAALAFGATPSRVLFDVELPMAMRTIMAGVNQTLMLALSMVVIASMIAVEGLGLLVLRGIGRLDMGLAAVGGLGIVILAIVLDRLTQATMEPKAEVWTDRGPAALVTSLLRGQRSAKIATASTSAPRRA